MQHSRWLMAINNDDKLLMKNLIDKKLGFSREFIDAYGCVIITLFNLNLTEILIYLLRKHDDIYIPQEVFEFFFLKKWRRQVELGIEVFGHPNAKPESKTIETLILTGFRFSECLATHYLTKNNTLLQTAIELLKDRKNKPHCTPKKVYRARKIFYQFIQQKICSHLLFELLPRTDKFLRFEFNLTKINNAICISHLRQSASNKYILYHYRLFRRLNIPINIMADRKYLPNDIKKYAKVLFMCNIDLHYPNEIIYLILTELL